MTIETGSDKLASVMKTTLLSFSFAVAFSLCAVTPSTAADRTAELQAAFKRMESSRLEHEALLLRLDNKRERAAAAAAPLPALPPAVKKPWTSHPLPGQYRKSFVAPISAISFRYQPSEFIWRSNKGAVVPGGDVKALAERLTHNAWELGKIPRSYHVVVRAEGVAEIVPDGAGEERDLLRWRIYETRQHIETLHQRITARAAEVRAKS